MSAIRLARAYTNRKFIVKFEGCYHGHSDALLVKAGSGVATLGIPGSAGVPEEFVEFTLALPTTICLRWRRRLPSSRTGSPASSSSPSWATWDVCPRSRATSKDCARLPSARERVLILDEVMTGFRLAFGGASELYNIKADLMTLGKIIGGGLPVGAYGGAAKIMDMVAPLGRYIRRER